MHFFVLFSILVQLRTNMAVSNGGMSGGELAYLLCDSLSHLSNFLCGFQQIFSTSRHDFDLSGVKCCIALYMAKEAIDFNM